MRARAILAAAAATAVAVTVPTAAFADTPVPAGAQIAAAANAAAVPTHYAGLWMAGKGGNWWVGSDKVTENGKTVIADCVIPGAALVTPTAVRTGIYGSKRETALLGYVMFNYGASSSDAVAAGGRLAMLKIAGEPIPGLKVPAKIATYARNDLLNAERYAGKPTASVVFGGKPATPGQPGGVKLDVISATGHVVPGIPVRFTAVSASLTAAGSSGEWKAFTRTSPAPVHVEGTATVASTVVVIGTAPHAQTLISAIPARVAAAASYQARPAPVKATVTCNCDGTGNVDGKATQAAGSAEGQYTMLVNGKAAASVTIPASRHGVTAELKAASVADGALVTFAARYRIAGRWTAPVALGGTFTVHCPVMPRVSFTSQCNCTPGTSTYTDKATVTVANPSGAYTDTVNYTVDGVKYVLTVAPGTSKTAALTVPTGAVSFGWSWTASI